MSCAREAEKDTRPETANATNVAAKREPIELEVFFIMRRAIVLMLVPEKSTVTRPRPQALDSLRPSLRLPPRQH
jgi:hypothetical protein